MMAQDVLNRETDLRTDQAVDIVSMGSHDLGELRRRWANIPMIPRALAKREDGIDNSWLGFDVRTLLIGEESGGRFSFHDIILAPGANFPFHHLDDVDTYWYVVDGLVELTIGDHTTAAEPDTLGYAPRNTTQAIKNSSSFPGRVIMWQSPAGYERAFAALKGLAQNQPDAPIDDLQKVLEQFGYRFHREAVRLENDKRVNVPTSRLEASVQNSEDFDKLRDDWSRRKAVPRLIIERNDCNDIPMDGQDTKVLISGDESAGDAVVFHLGVASGYRAPPHHQPSEEEIFLIIEGELELVVGNRTEILKAGGFGFAPRYGTHSFQNLGTRPMRMVTINSPAGHERGFEMLVHEADKGARESDLIAHGWRLHEE